MSSTTGPSKRPSSPAGGQSPTGRRSVLAGNPESTSLLQRRLRFLMRLYIGSWIVFYALVRGSADLYMWTLANVPGTSWLSPMGFVWVAATLTALVLGSIYWFMTREPDEPTDDWRKIESS